jgi:hypothetical protein
MESGLDWIMAKPQINSTGRNGFGFPKEIQQPARRWARVISAATLNCRQIKPCARRPSPWQRTMNFIYL